MALGASTAEYGKLSNEAELGQGGTRYPSEVAEWQCGEQRLALRKAFNVNEITAAKLVQKYDSDGNKILEPSELHTMLKDYNCGRAPKKDDLDFIMVVADRDHDSRISQDEILFALRAWYAYVNMPPSVAATFTKYEISGDMLPSVEALRELLVVLNEQQPVGVEEATYVRELCLSLGASEMKVSLQQMRQAVSAWYLHIERGETPKATLLHQAAAAAHHRICNLPIFDRLCHGECDYRARGTRLILVALCLGCVAMPCLELTVAQTVPTPVVCEHPQLSSLLYWTGLLGLVHTCAIVLLMALRRSESKPLRISAWSFFALVTAGLFTLYGYGMSRVVSSTAHHCGIVLWEISQLVYVVVPFVLVVFACLGVPCLYCCVGGKEFFKVQNADESLRTA